MTSVSSLASALNQYKSSISSLDKNGDGVISADELAAAGQTSTATSSTSSSSSSSTSTTGTAADLINKVQSDILSMMLSIQSSDSSDSSDDDSSSDVQNLFTALDANGDGSISEDELANANPETLAETGSNSELAKTVVDGLLRAQQAYQNTYGASAAASDS